MQRYSHCDGGENDISHAEIACAGWTDMTERRRAKHSGRRCSYQI
jgi:hypothetical protein